MDTVEAMIDRVQAEWRAGEPLHYTMNRVWTSTHVPQVDVRALAAVGWQAVADAEGPPKQYPLPNQIRAAVWYDDALLSDSDVAALAFIGFVTVASEQLATDGWVPGTVQ